jgi:hypothetical protein
VAPALRSPFSNRPTRVVTVSLIPPNSLGFSASILLVDSLNVNRYGCGGKHLLSMGASLHQSVPIRCSLTVFIHHDLHRHVEPLTFTAPSRAALPLPSLKVHFPVTMTQALASIGLSMSSVGPMCSSLGATIEELDPAVVLDSLLHMRRTIPV